MNTLDKKRNVLSTKTFDTSHDLDHTIFEQDLIQYTTH